MDGPITFWLTLFADVTSVFADGASAVLETSESSEGLTEVSSESRAPALPSGSTARSQWMMVAGFLMLGWVLARRTIRNRKKSRIDNRTAERELERARNPVSHSVPLSDAPPELQRWQVAMYDVQRELTAELDSRISVVESLLRQIDERSGANAMTDARMQRQVPDGAVSPPQRLSTPLSGDRLLDYLRDAEKQGKTPEQMADDVNLPVGEILWSLATLTPDAKVHVPGTTTQESRATTQELDATDSQSETPVAS